MQKSIGDWGYATYHYHIKTSFIVSGVANKICNSQ